MDARPASALRCHHALMPSNTSCCGAQRNTGNPNVDSVMNTSQRTGSNGRQVASGPVL